MEDYGSERADPALLSDLEALRDEGGTEGDSRDALFLGALVLQIVEPAKGAQVPLNSIIDGQQRILTIYLTLTAIAEAFQIVGDEDEAEAIESEYLLVRTGRNKNRPRVEPTLTDSRQFRQIMACLKHPTPRFANPGHGPESHHLSAAWKEIRRRVHRLCSQQGDLSPQLLEELRDDIVERLELVEITLGMNHDPHEVYERLNTLGSLSRSSISSGTRYSSRLVATAKRPRQSTRISGNRSSPNWASNIRTSTSSHTP